MKKHYMILATLLITAMSTGYAQQTVKEQSIRVEIEKQEGTSTPGEVKEMQKMEEAIEVAKESTTGKLVDTGKEYPKDSDVRRLDGFQENINIDEKSLTKELIASYTFNENTDFRGFEEVANEIMEAAKNPGLGVRKLHEAGITGKGVNVAIIDQPIAIDHPEYRGKIVEYENLCGREGGESSMHGPAVTSILAGNTIGVAPDVKIYYVAAPSWKKDALYQAQALRWIIEENKKLPSDQKIRIVSISAAPSGKGSPFNKNNEEWDKAYEEAKKEGILVIDCTDKTNIGACYLDGSDREDPKCYKGGFGKNNPAKMDPKYLLAPVASRTTAETYKNGVYSYQYGGTCGLSWGIPYAVGTLALGWQIAPELSNEEIMNLFNDTATVNSEGSKIITPTAFVEAVKKAKK